MELSMDEIRNLPGNTQLFRLAEIDVTSNKAINYDAAHPRKDLKELREYAKILNIVPLVLMGRRDTRWEVRSVYAAALR